MHDQARPNGHGPEPAEIIPANNGQLARPEESVKDKLDRAQRQIDYRKGILKLIATNIEPEDIAIYGEGEKANIHLTKTACKQILSWAGITVQPDNGIQEKRYDGEEGPYIDFEVWATWLTPDGKYYRSMGNRATFDDFFAKRTRYTCAECGAPGQFRGDDFYCTKDNKKVRWTKDNYYLPLTEVDIPAVKQAAITNLWNHIVEDAGLKPSKKELASVGFNFAAVGQRIEFGGEKKAAQAPAQTRGQATQGPPASAKPPAAQPPQPAPTAAPAPKPAGPPKAEIPRGPLGSTVQASLPSLPEGHSIMRGVITEAYLNETKSGKNAGAKYVRLNLFADEGNGNQTLYCFHNSQVLTRDGDQNLLQLLVDSRRKRAELIVKQGTKGCTIEGALRIGPYGWETDGTPIAREPGE